MSEKKEEKEKKFKSLTFTSTKKKCEICEKDFNKSEIEEYRNKYYCAPCLHELKDDEKKKRDEKKNITASTPQTQMIDQFNSQQTIIVNAEMSMLQQQITNLLQSHASMQSEIDALKSENIISPSSLESEIIRAFQIPKGLDYFKTQQYVANHPEIPDNEGYFLTRMKREFKFIQIYCDLLRLNKYKNTQK